MEVNKILQGDALKILKTLPSESIDCVITSPPYWNLRDYGIKGQLGLEETFDEYITKLIWIFNEVKRVLKKEGTCWVNLGDTYGGSGKGYGDKNPDPKFKSGGRERTLQPKPTNTRNKAAGGVPQLEATKSLCQIPSRFAIAMTNQGWILRNEIIWHKPNCMPSSAEDRFTVDFEKIFFFVKNKNYYFEQQKELAVWDLDGNGSIKRAERQREGLKSNPTEMKNGIRKVYPNGKHKDGQQSPKFVNGYRNKRAVWKVITKGFPEAHFAAFPEALIEPMVMAGCPKEGIVLDIFMGAGTTALVAKNLKRNYLGIELNKEYIKMANGRLRQDVLF